MEQTIVGNGIEYSFTPVIGFVKCSWHQSRQATVNVIRTYQPYGNTYMEACCAQCKHEWEQIAHGLVAPRN